MYFAAREAHKRKVRERERAEKRERERIAAEKVRRREELIQEVFRRLRVEWGLSASFAADIAAEKESLEEGAKKEYANGLQEGRVQERKRILKCLKQKDLLTLEVVELILDDWASE